MYTRRRRRKHFVILKPFFTRICKHRHFHMRSLHTNGLHTQPFICELFHIRTTYPYTHTHRHHLRTIFSPITDDFYFSFSFLRNQISAKSRVRLLPNPISSKEFSYRCVSHITAIISHQNTVSPTHSLSAQIILVRLKRAFQVT